MNRIVFCMMTFCCITGITYGIDSYDDFSTFDTTTWTHYGGTNIDVNSTYPGAVFARGSRDGSPASRITQIIPTGVNDFEVQFDYRIRAYNGHGRISMGWMNINDFASVQDHSTLQDLYGWYQQDSQGNPATGLYISIVTADTGGIQLVSVSNGQIVSYDFATTAHNDGQWYTAIFGRDSSNAYLKVFEQNTGNLIGDISILVNEAQNHDYFHISTLDNIANNWWAEYEIDNLSLSIDFQDCNQNGIDDEYEVWSGLSSDSDGDGIIDDCDCCPDTPAGHPVMENGCSTKPTFELLTHPFSGPHSITASEDEVIYMGNSQTGSIKRQIGLNGVLESFGPSFTYPRYVTYDQFGEVADPPGCVIVSTGNVSDPAPPVVAISPDGSTYTTVCNVRTGHLAIDSTGRLIIATADGRICAYDQTNGLVCLADFKTMEPSLTSAMEVAIDQQDRIYACYINCGSIARVNADGSNPVLLNTGLYSSSTAHKVLEIYEVAPGQERIVLLEHAADNQIQHMVSMDLDGNDKQEWLSQTDLGGDFNGGFSGLLMLEPGKMLAVGGSNSLSGFLMQFNMPYQYDDCNRNCVADDQDILDGTSQDCNTNGYPDECDTLDGTSADVNSNGIPDECETDCNSNGTPDDYDIAQGISSDCNMNGIPDECEEGNHHRRRHRHRHSWQ